MADIITARLSDDIPEPELSRMWESERTTFSSGPGDGIENYLDAPEIVIEKEGRDVRLRFHGGPKDREHRKLKDAFERAVHRMRPDVRVDWAA